MPICAECVIKRRVTSISDVYLLRLRGGGGGLGTGPPAGSDAVRLSADCPQAAKIVAVAGGVSPRPTIDLGGGTPAAGC